MIHAALPDERRQFSVASDVFLRALAVVYFIAFASFWWQLRGLIGPGGILPAQPFLDATARELGPGRWWQLPTLCWIFDGGWFLHALCLGGVGLAVAVFFRILQPVCLALLWMFYLSLCPPGQVFLNFQWDALLLETGLLAVWLAPWRLGGRERTDPPRLARWLLWWLFFRLLFMSGLVKLTSGDETWRNLTALTLHYETQPLPTWLGCWMHQLPAWFHRLSCAIMFAIELLVPFLLFGPQRVRHCAVLAQIAFQVIIALTGNYTFFNLLTVALCLLFLDDSWWARWFGVAPAPYGSTAAGRRPPPWAMHAVFAVLLAASLLITLPSAVGPRQWPEWYAGAFRIIATTRSVNSYGLFRVMTKERPEIIIEGSADGREWQPYEFKWKPGDLKRRPGFIAPHQPRLDWQLWFAALAYPRFDSWMTPFLRQLAANAPAVTALLEKNPFAREPPHYLRAVLYNYEFTTPAERASSGAWWKRTTSAYYLPPTRVR